MKDNTHPEPAGKNGNDSGDETGMKAIRSVLIVAKSTGQS